MKMPTVHTDWEIDANGIISGPLRLGMSIEEVKRAFGTDFDRFRRCMASKNDTLAFDRHGVHVVLDDRGTAVAGLGVFPPNRLTLAGVQLLGQPIPELQSELSLLGFDFEICDAGLCNSAMDVCLVEVEGIVDGAQIGLSG
jgi:hypothetical protein